MLNKNKSKSYNYAITFDNFINLINIYYFINVYIYLLAYDILFLLFKK